MANIKIIDLSSVEEYDFIIDVNDTTSVSILGGANNNFSELMKFAIKSMEFILLAYAIDSITRLATSFKNS